ncbi:MFS transporter [Brevibacterium aurantiacum]|nr:MFS transporter [Brevibacterium aurantiacum]
MSNDLEQQDDPVAEGDSRLLIGARLFALVLGTFTVGLAEYVLIGQLDFVAAGLGTSESVAGQLVTAFAIAYAVCTPLMVALLARVARRKVLVSNFAIFAALSAVSYLLPEFWGFAAARVVMAVSAGIIVVTSIGSVSRILPPNALGRGIATVQTGFTASLVLGVPLGRVLAEALGWRSVFLAMAVLAIVSAVLVRLLLPSMPGRPGVKLGRQLSLLGDRRVLHGLAITVLWLGGYSLVYTYLAPYMLQIAGISGGLVTLVLFLFGLASLFGTQIGGAYTDRQGFYRSLLHGKALHIVFLAVLPFAAMVSSAAAILVLIVWSFSAWFSASAQQVRIAAIDQQESDMLIGLNQSAMQVAIAIGAAAGGMLIPVFGLAPLPWIGAALVLASLALLLASNRGARHVPELTAERGL